MVMGILTVTLTVMVMVMVQDPSEESRYQGMAEAIAAVKSVSETLKQ